MNTQTLPFLNKYFHELEYPYLTWHETKNSLKTFCNDMFWLSRHVDLYKNRQWNTTNS